MILGNPSLNPRAKLGCVWMRTFTASHGERATSAITSAEADPAKKISESYFAKNSGPAMSAYNLERHKQTLRGQPLHTHFHFPSPSVDVLFEVFVKAEFAGALEGVSHKGRCPTFQKTPGPLFLDDRRESLGDGAVFFRIDLRLSEHRVWFADPPGQSCPDLPIDAMRRVKSLAHLHVAFDHVQRRDRRVCCTTGDNPSTCTSHVELRRVQGDASFGGGGNERVGRLLGRSFRRLLRMSIG